MYNSKVLKGFLTLLFISLLAISGMSQADVARRTTAITYPLDEQVFVQFRGTTRFPRMKGEAKIKRTGRRGTEIELSVSKMPRPFELGAGYATYVLWAVSPEGAIDNLGEIKRRGFFEFDSKINVTTPLQTFALIITAEPHFLVRQPSQAIMLENLSPYTTSGRTIATTPSVQYFGNSSDYFRDARTPEIAEIDYSKTPSAVLQAKQAVALARYAGADRDATEELTEAETLLKTAEDAWQANREDEVVDIAARRAISAAVKAESTALVRKAAREKRNEQSRTDAEIRAAEDKYSDAMTQVAELKAQLADETRGRELSERDVATYTQQIRELRAENTRLSEELGRTRVEADTAKNRLAQVEAEKQAAVKVNALQANEGAFMESLRRFGSVSKNERGIILTLPENFWSGIRSVDFSPAATPKLGPLGELLANNPDYRVSIESHTDDRGTPDELLALTQQRSALLSQQLASFGVADGRMEAKGLGSSLPVAPNTTNANRAKNRRVHLILVPSVN